MGSENLQKRRRLTKGLENELARCEAILEKRFGNVFCTIPLIELKKTFYGGIIFKAEEKDITKLKTALRKINHRDAMPGEIAFYKSHEQDSYYFIEIKPYTTQDMKDLVENSRQIANYLATFLEEFFRNQ
tara:strand:+ start:490 stop:879 length:390 start_codon:yes stop_codon:yes gene_type:complete